MPDMPVRENLVFLDAGTVDFGDLSFSSLRCFGPLRVYHATSSAQIPSRVRHATGLITNKCILDARVLKAAPKLRHIHLAATGFNNVDLETACSRGIAVTNVRHYCSEAVAQYTLGMILALAGQIPAFDQAVKAGRWSRSPFFVLSAFPVQELRGRTLGILGYGAIGRQVARLALAFGMRVRIAALPGRAYSIAEKKRRLPLGRLLEKVDYLTIHAPLTEQTRGLIDASALARMKPGAFLINMARGGIVNEKALAQALRKGRLAGAASDVLAHEPPPKDHVLLKAPNILLTPHVSWATLESRRRAVGEIGLNIQAFLKGRRRNRIV